MKCARCEEHKDEKAIQPRVLYSRVTAWLCNPCFIDILRAAENGPLGHEWRRLATAKEYNSRSICIKNVTKDMVEFAEAIERDIIKSITECEWKLIDQALRMMPSFGKEADGEFD